jgi:hypothetical protein
MRLNFIYLQRFILLPICELSTLAGKCPIKHEKWGCLRIRLIKGKQPMELNFIYLQRFVLLSPCKLRTTGNNPTKYEKWICLRNLVPVLFTGCCCWGYLHECFLTLPQPATLQLADHHDVDGMGEVSIPLPSLGFLVCLFGEAVS